jgi:hypothetical protein
MTRADLAASLAIYAATLAGGSVLWILLFHSPLLDTWVFFYRGLALLGVATAAVITTLVALRRGAARRLIGLRDMLLIASLLVSVNTVLFTHLPVTADRSISVFMLAYMDRASDPLTVDEISEVVVREYVEERQAVAKRLDEQIATGTLVDTPDGYVISPEGRWLVGVYHVIADLFNIDPRNLAP